MNLHQPDQQLDVPTRSLRPGRVAVLATIAALVLSGVALPAHATEAGGDSVAEETQTTVEPASTVAAAAADPLRSASRLGVADEQTLVTPVVSNTNPGESAGVLYSPRTVRYGEPITLSGSGWFLLNGSGGSAGPIFINQHSGSGQVRVAGRTIENQVPGSTYDDSRAHGVFQSDAEGRWSITIPFPTPENSALAEPWQPGQTQTIRILTGSLAEGDHGRNPLISFVVTAADGGEEPDPGQGEPPIWSHHTVSGGGATAWIEREIAAGDAGRIRIKGTGWQNSRGDGASTIAVKLNAGDTRQHERSGAAIVSHPSAPGDATIWALVAPENPTAHEHVFDIDAQGNFEILLDGPPGLVAGQYLSVRFQSGLFAEGDVQRTLTSDFLVVGGTAYVPDAGGEDAVCVPGTDTPQLQLRESGVPVGGILRVFGTGWCHPGEGRGGSRVAIKIDEGAYSHHTSDVHSNRTIWALVDADPDTGNWELDMQLPDGTAATSIPAFPTGAHTLRVLSGSLKDGDAGRSMLSEPFVVGAYAPGALPNPIDVSGGALHNDTKNGVVVQRNPADWLVTVPGAAPGDWVYVDTYAGASARAPFPAWHRLNANRQVRLSLHGVTLQAGDLRVTVQSGNQGEVGELLGWAAITVAVPPVDRPVPAPLPTVSGSGGGARVAVAAGTAPASVPAPPVKRGSQLISANAGRVTGTIDGDLVTLSVADGSPNQWIYAYVYTGVQTRPIGWVQLDTARQLRVDIADLPDGNHKIALVGVDGQLIGWASAAKGKVIPVKLRQQAAEPQAILQEQTTVDPERVAGAPEWLPNVLLAGGALLLLGGTVTTALVIRNRRDAE